MSITFRNISIPITVVACSLFQGLPSFGPYKEKRTQIIAEQYKNTDLLTDDKKPPAIRPSLEPKKPVPSVKVFF